MNQSVESQADPQALDPQTLASWRQALKDGRSAAYAALDDHQNPTRLLADLSALVDATLRQLWTAMDFDGCASLVAVGGYGRGELFPYSDVDVLMLLPEDQADALAPRMEQLIGMLWDLGLEIGHSVRTVRDCVEQASQDLTVATALLEARWLAGPKELFQAMSTRVQQALDPQQFARGKLLEMQQRHAKYQDTPYSLEPNVKESPGGLRDLQVILWIAKAAGYGRSWSELARNGMVTRAEAMQLRRYERNLQRFRANLHLTAGRREDRLVFDLQNLVAARMGFQAVGSRRPSEVLMQRYYLTAKAITQLNAILLQNIQGQLFPVPDAQPQPIDAQFQMLRGQLDLVDDQVFERDHSAILRAFVVAAKHPQLPTMSVRMLRALWHARRHLNGTFRRNPAHRALFVEILQQPRGVTRMLRRMNQWGILGRYLPVFRRIVGQMQHDLFHVYTVDQHTMMVVRNLRRFMMAEHAHEYPTCSQLIAAFDQPWLIYTAALFHDIAKGRGGDHSTLGAVDVRRFCKLHAISDDDARFISFLVEHHLTMSTVAQKQDLSDPDVIERFAKLVGDERKLTALYLLTVADIRGTSPKVWNGWKGKLLEDLYRMTRRVLVGDAWAPAVRMDAKKAEALRVLRLYGFSDDVHQALWKHLDVAFFLRHDAQLIAWLTRALYRKVDTEEPVVKARLSPGGEGLEVAVYARDQADLFARICNFFDAQHYSIVDARVHTTKHGYALDTFVVISPDMADHYREMIALIEHELKARIVKAAPLAAPSKPRLSRQSKHFPVEPSVDIRPDERGQYYLLSVAANDRPGLLYGIARVLAEHKVNLHTAKIHTLGERVEDVFVVDSPSLTSGRAQLELENDMMAAVRV